MHSDGRSRGGYLDKENVKHIEVFRLDANAGKWAIVDAFSAPAKDIFADTETATCMKGNCIFYDDPFIETDLGVRVFDMETGTINKFDIQSDPSLIFWPPPAWAYIG